MKVLIERATAEPVEVQAARLPSGAVRFAAFGRGLVSGRIIGVMELGSQISMAVQAAEEELESTD